MFFADVLDKRNYDDTIPPVEFVEHSYAVENYQKLVKVLDSRWVIVDGSGEQTSISYFAQVKLLSAKVVNF